MEKVDPLQQALDALRWYADTQNYEYNLHCRHCSGDRWSDDFAAVEKDHGKRAQEALLAITGEKRP